MIKISQLYTSKSNIYIAFACRKIFLSCLANFWAKCHRYKIQDSSLKNRTLMRLQPYFTDSSRWLSHYITWNGWLCVVKNGKRFAKMRSFRKYVTSYEAFVQGQIDRNSTRLHCCTMHQQERPFWPFSWQKVHFKNTTCYFCMSIAVTFVYILKGRTGQPSAQVKKKTATKLSIFLLLAAKIHKWTQRI